MSDPVTADRADDNGTAKVWTVGDLRTAMADCNASDQIVVMQSGREDMAVEDAGAALLIPWGHDCADAEEGHKPGRDCPTGHAFEIHIQPITEFTDV